ncbi:N-acetylneuraminate lyase [Chitinophaga terrae (ex Kim and Jung 2007)]|uniref:N-acetylneuraminate lyase n=1 Tax=Chitinophaga terrae (ex Kim and Jung 2007) TaxID=408074 RepID=A0A1H4CZS7_9BACT|nr:dihydrodipicolinate synthase family protein [Chitinophaga terrae (ex Kim and Jung 2007)]GEP90657.1 N-acetylneuraminate lyase [Chitinophaga terrae (ex Kim and Jung 2007)]SEA65766.1 N-acetylneuraminate lyase [Chitinophaga terrae (ex Kim and Jung 2007)]
MKIQGLIAATFSTFHADGSLDLSLVQAIVDKLVSQGVKGVFICGTNGEGPNLTSEERMATVEAYIKAVNKRCLVLVHVGHSSIAEARRLAAHAQQAGADAISAVSAFYFKPASAHTMVDCMAEIAAAAPALPFYYYHIPAITGVAVNPLEFLQLGEERIPNLAGIKYTASTLHEYQACLNYGNGKFDILFGYDELLLPALSVGAKGAIGSTYTFAAPLYLKVMQLFNDGQLEAAREMQYQAVKMIQCLGWYSPIPAQKAIMKLLGTDLGPCRLPLKALTDDQQAKIAAYLEQIGFAALLGSVTHTAV